LATLSTNREPVFLTQRVIPRRFNVLIVDDSGYNLYVMKMLLQTIPLTIDVSTAFNGVEALEIVQMHNCPPENAIRG
jgi:CheY-like chemotaxis protein